MKVKIIGKSQQMDLKQLCEFSEVQINLELVRRYWRTVVANKKQPQSNYKFAGLNRSVKSPGTNKGESRQKYSIVNGKRQKSGAPNNRKGRRALFYNKDQSLKMNKKERRLAIKQLIYLTLIKSELYMVQKLEDLKTNEFLKLGVNAGGNLKNYILEPRNRKRVKNGPVILLGSSYDKYFRNFSKVLNLRTSNELYGLYNGSTTRPSFIFEINLLKEFLKKYEI